MNMRDNGGSTSVTGYSSGGGSNNLHYLCLISEPNMNMNANMNMGMNSHMGGMNSGARDDGAMVGMGR